MKGTHMHKGTSAGFSFDLFLEGTTATTASQLAPTVATPLACYHADGEAARKGRHSKCWQAAARLPTVRTRL